jgi:Flp pilus assembly pilin Flp
LIEVRTMKRSVAACAIALFLWAVPAISQFADPPAGVPARSWTGDIRTDLFSSSDPLPRFQQEGGVDRESGGSYKSPWLAAGFSLAVPGAGEFYAGNYWKSALFLAVEVGAWVLAARFDRRGDDATAAFEQFADAHWSVVRYAEYSLNNLIVSDRRGQYLATLYLPQGEQGSQPWEKLNWEVLNAMEREIAGYYSHVIPRHGDQQYFEMIGKYPQFNQGWDDADQNSPSDYEYIKAHLTANFLAYRDQRGAANDEYDRAATFVTVAIVNHVISAIDAAWTAASANRAHAQARVMRVPGPHGAIPVAALSIELPL